MASILQNHYVLAVHDVRVSAEFYVRALGFQIAADHGGWIFVARDNVMIMLGECRDAKPAAETGDHSYFAYLRVDDVDAFHADLRSAGITTMKEPVNQPWKMREFGLTTPDGHRLMIGQKI